MGWVYKYNLICVCMAADEKKKRERGEREGRKRAGKAFKMRKALMFVGLGWVNIFPGNFCIWATY